MARENQGLQIALIIFFMLTIILGVTTFVFFKQYEEADKEAVAANAKYVERNTTARTKIEECEQLMKYLGCAPTDKLDAVTAQYDTDMKTFGGSYPNSDEVLDYHKLLGYLFGAIEKKNAELTDVQNRIDSMKAEQARLLAAEKAQVAQYQLAAKTAGDRLKAVTTTAKGVEARMLQENTGYMTDKDNAEKKAGEDMAAMEATLNDARVNFDKLTLLNKQKAEKLDKLTKETIEVPDGEIRWVDQGTRMVWIDLGRADGLTRQITFSVYPIDITNLAKAGKKASVEVTQIRGEHSAEARIIDDNISDPIMMGDKIHTPLWAPGEHKRFALAGFMDIDEDDKSDLHVVRDLISMNGGTVDCWIEDGEQKGRMSENIRYLVLGEAPSVKRDENIAAFSKIVGDAEKLGIQKIQLGDLLQQMGWKNQTPVVRFGKGANPNDFRPKPPEGVPSVSRGNVSGLFRPRRPPTQTRSGRGGAY